MSDIRFDEQTEPTTPPTGKATLYVDSADKEVSVKKDDGSVQKFLVGLGGNDTEVQFNDGGAFAGDPKNTWDKNTATKAILGNIIQQGGTETLNYAPTIQSTTATDTNPRDSVGQGAYVYVVDSGGDNVKIYIRNPDGSTALVATSIIFGNLRGCDVSGDILFVSDTGTGGRILAIDVKDKTNAGVVLISSVVVGGSPRGIKVKGDKLIVSNNSVGMQTIDICDINDMKLEGSFPPVGGNFSQQFDTQGDFIYAVSTSSPHFYILEVDQDGIITQRSARAVSGGALAVAVQGAFAFVTTESTRELLSFDISDPDSTDTPDGAVELDPITSDPVIINVNGGFIQVADQNQEAIHIIDIKDPLDMKIIGKSAPFPVGSNPVAMTTIGPSCIVLDNALDQFYILDLSGLDIQNARMGSVEIGNADIIKNLRIGGTLGVGSGINVGGGINALGAINGPNFCKLGRDLSTLAQDVIEIRDASDFNAVAGIITPPSLATKYRLLAPIVMSDRFVLPADQLLVIDSPFQDVCSLTYTGTGTLFTAASLNDFRLEFMNVFNAGAGTLFDLTGSVTPGIISLAFCGFGGFASLGSIDSFQTVSIRDSIFEDNADGFIFTDSVFSIRNIGYENSTDTGSTFITIDGTGNTVANITGGAFSLQPNETLVDVDSGIGANSFISISDNVRPLGDSGTFFDATGLNETDPRLSVSGNEKQKDSLDFGNMSIMSSETVTITTAGVPVIVNDTNTGGTNIWTEVNKERFTFDASLGRLTYIGIADTDALVITSSTLQKVGGGTDQIGTYIALNGTVIGESLSITENSAPSSVTSIANKKISTGDFFELAVVNQDSTSNVIVDLSNFIVD